MATKHFFDIKLGTVKGLSSFGQFMAQLYRTDFEYTDRMFICGRLYRGFVGMMVIFYRFRFDLMIHWPDKELRAEAKITA